MYASKREGPRRRLGVRRSAAKRFRKGSERDRQWSENREVRSKCYKRRTVSEGQRRIRRMRDDKRGKGRRRIEGRGDKTERRKAPTNVGDEREDRKSFGQGGDDGRKTRGDLVRTLKRRGIVLWTLVIGNKEGRFIYTIRTENRTFGPLST